VNALESVAASRFARIGDFGRNLSFFCQIRSRGYEHAMYFRFK